MAAVPAVSNEIQAPEPMVRKFRGVEKVAALILGMGQTNAARVLSHFDSDEIRMITRIAAQLGSVNAKEMETIIEEFVKQFGDGASLYGSVNEVQKLLTGVLPEDEVSDIIADVAGSSNWSIWDRIANISETAIANYIKKEHPQTAAFILSRSKPTAAAKIMNQLPPELRNQLMRRMLTIKPIVPEAARDIEKVLHEDFLLNFSGNMQADTFSRMADILNKMERDQMEAALNSLEERQPKAAEALKGLLFTFDDIINLTPRARMAIFDQINTEAIVMALKGTDQGLRQSILSTLASRTRRIIEHELASGQPAAERDVFAARREITDLALEMAGRGEIDLNPKQEGGAFLQ
ncbi:flagellar motor switch protein FliG [uncultured Cohaesibacter sp.]|uniref:flagellar motor switch protein FliG n=1 Tax=uncultured Cohaesibacter sp. TaxID=1002546 RepID=UPI0037480556